MYLSTNRLTWVPDGKTFVTEASDCWPKGSNQPHQLWPDSCDEGCVLISHRTGDEAMFYFDEVIKDGEGDIIMWVFLPTDEAIRKHPKLNGVKLEVFND